MQGSKQNFPNAQRGVSLSGLIFVLAVIGFVAVFAMKVFPTFLEYRAIQGAITAAKATRGTVAQMKETFNKHADIDRIDSISAKDLVFSSDNGETDISYAYKKLIPIAGNVSLLIDYSGTTARNGMVALNPESTAK
jgi:Tfp pilus assembly protein FimT